MIYYLSIFKYNGDNNINTFYYNDQRIIMYSHLMNRYGGLFNFNYCWI